MDGGHREKALYPVPPILHSDLFTFFGGEEGDVLGKSGRNPLLPSPILLHSAD